MYNVGDPVVHALGVAKITAIDTLTVAGSNVEAYKIHLISGSLLVNKAIMFIPVQSAQRVLRPIMDKQDALAVMELIEQHIQRPKPATSWKSAANILKESLLHLTSEKLINLFLSYYRSYRCAYEGELFATVAARLITEIACAIGRDIDAVRATIAIHIADVER